MIQVMYLAARFRSVTPTWTNVTRTLINTRRTSPNKRRRRRKCATASSVYRGTRRCIGTRRSGTRSTPTATLTPNCPYSAVCGVQGCWSSAMFDPFWVSRKICYTVNSIAVGRLSRCACVCVCTYVYSCVLLLYVNVVAGQLKCAGINNVVTNICNWMGQGPFFSSLRLIFILKSKLFWHFTVRYSFVFVFYWIIEKSVIYTVETKTVLIEWNKCHSSPTSSPSISR